MSVSLFIFFFIDFYLTFKFFVPFIVGQMKWNCGSVSSFFYIVVWLTQFLIVFLFFPFFMNLWLQKTYLKLLSKLITCDFQLENIELKQMTPFLIELILTFWLFAVCVSILLHLGLIVEGVGEWCCNKRVEMIKIQKGSSCVDFYHSCKKKKEASWFNINIHQVKKKIHEE